MTTTIYCLVILLLGLTGGSAFAHFLEFPNKMALDGPEWFLVQTQIYDGWGKTLSLLLWPMLGGLLFLSIRHANARVFWIAVLVLVLIAEVGIWGFVIRPVNAVVNAPGAIWPLDGWENYRATWEWAHIARTVIYAAAILLAARAGAMINGRTH